MNKVLVSNKTDEWTTPKKLYELYMKLGYFDPCPVNHTEDGLKIDWKLKNFVNPPYSNLKAWVEKAIDEYKKGKEVILLIPARTDTIAFEMLTLCKGEMVFIKGRLKFGESKKQAPFPSMIVLLNKYSETWTSEWITIVSAKDIENVDMSTDSWIDIV